MGEHPVQEQLAEAMTRLADLERRVAEQDAELHALRSVAATDPSTMVLRSVAATDPSTSDIAIEHDPRDAAPGSTPAKSSVDADPRPDRRAMLRRTGIALAGAAGAGAILEVAGASPAAAVDGLPVLAGQSNTATAETAIEFGGATLPSNMFTVANGPTAGVTGAAIAGVAAAETAASHGVIGLTDSEDSFGVIGRGRGAGSIGVRAEGDRAAIRLIPSSGDPRTSIGSHTVGEIYQDLQDNTWVCVVSGGPGKWRQIAGPTTIGALHLLDVPKRVYDSRTGFAPNDVPKGKLTQGGTRVINARHGDAFPPGSLAVLINLTATNTDGGGWLAAFKNGIPFPGTSTLNWSAAGTNIANGATVALDLSDQFKVQCAGSCDFAVDVIGYYF